MTDFVNAYLDFASQGFSEGFIAIVFPGGFFMLVFGEKRKPVKAKPAPIKQRNAKRKSGKVAKVKPPEKAKVVKVKEADANRVERETHKATPEEILAADRYRAGRDRITFNDNWN